MPEMRLNVEFTDAITAGTIGFTFEVEYVVEFRGAMI